MTGELAPIEDPNDRLDDPCEACKDRRAESYHEGWGGWLCKPCIAILDEARSSLPEILRLARDNALRLKRSIWVVRTPSGYLAGTQSELGHNGLLPHVARIYPDGHVEPREAHETSET